MKPLLVSICIPVYNSEKYLLEILRSIENQSYKKIEVIISDNASIDSSVQIIQSFILNKHNWKLVTSKTNIGAVANFNKLIEYANGDLVAIYHADDVYHENIVEDSVNAFVDNPEIGLVGTLGESIDSKGNKIATYVLPDNLKSHNNKYTLDDLFFGAIALKDNKTILITPSIMVKKQVYNELGVFSIEGKSAGDYELWFRIVKKYPIYIINKVLISYRIHNEQGSHLEIRKNNNIPDLIQVCEKYIPYVKSQKVRNIYKWFYDKSMLVVALKQNNMNRFEESNKVLQNVRTLKGKFYASIIKVANKILFSINYYDVKKIYKKFYR